MTVCLLILFAATLLVTHNYNHLTVNTIVDNRNDNIIAIQCVPIGDE